MHSPPFPLSSPSGPVCAPHPHPLQLITCLHMCVTDSVLIRKSWSAHHCLNAHTRMLTYPFHCVHPQITLTRGEAKQHRNLFESGDDFKRRCTAVNLKANITSHLLSTHSCFICRFLPPQPALFLPPYSMHSCRGALIAPLQKSVEENACAARVV